VLELELVMPAYNESKSLPAMVERAAAAAAGAGYAPETFRLVVVENGSRDDSREVLRRLAESVHGPWLRVVEVDVNQGYGYGLMRGLASTTAPFVAWTHADMQCDPADVFRALKVLQAEPSPRTLVKGRRLGRDWKERLVSRVFEGLARVVLGLSVHEMNAQPKVFPRTLLAELKKPPLTFAFDLYALYCARRAGFAVRTIDVRFPPRVHGVSNWAGTLASRRRTILGMIRYMLRLARTEGRL